MRRATGAVAVLGLLLLGSACPRALGQGPSARVAVLSQQGAWCWFADPRAVHVVGSHDQTFVGWISWNGAVTVGAYDHLLGVVRSAAVGRLYHDDHGSPSLFVEPDKRLTVFWSAHNGSKLFYRSTLQPEDITAWGPVHTVPSRVPGHLGFTYPNPLSLPAEGNRLYLFWRGADWSQDYATRTPDGRWTPARRLIEVPGHNRPYVKTESNGADTIALAFTNGHPRDHDTSIYYVAYRHGSLWRASGRWVTSLARAPIAPRRADLVYDAKAHHAAGWVWDVAFGSSARPVIVYATFGSTRNHKYWYAQWNGRRWASHFMTFAGGSISPGTIEQQYSGGVALDHSNPSIVYVSREVRGLFEIERWTTDDGGHRWRHVTVVRDGTDSVRPVVPRGSDGGPIGLLWMSGRYGTYTSYRTAITFLR